MILPLAAAERVGEVGYVIRPTQRRERQKQQRPFPDVPGEDERDEDETAPAAPTDPAPTGADRAPKDEADGEHRVDIRVSGVSGVSGVFLPPTRQFLPGAERVTTLH